MTASPQRDVTGRKCAGWGKIEKGRSRNEKRQKAEGVNHG
jgi:hypothetical protein